MSRRKSAVKRSVLPDARYDSQTVSKFVNVLMLQGKKSTAERIFYGAMDLVENRTSQPATKAAPAGERPLAKLPRDAEIASGRVDVQFAVDQAGCVDMRTVTVLESNNRDATEAVKRVLPLYRYSPAVRNGVPVRQWVIERVRVGR